MELVPGDIVRVAPRAARALRRRTGSRVTRRGAAVVEFALLAPLLVALMLGLLEVGQLFLVRQTLIVATRDGARLATQTGPQVAETQVQRMLAEAQLGAATVTTTPGGSPIAAGTPVTVSASIPFSDASWMPPFFLSGYTVSVSATMRQP